MVPEPIATRYTLGDPADEVGRVHIATDDGERWYVSNWCGQWLDEHGQWDWPPRSSEYKRHREQRKAWRAARRWDYATALKLAQAAFEEAKK